MATVRRLQLRFCSRPSQKGTAPQPQKWARFRGPKTGPQTAACEVSCELMWKRRSLNNLRFVSKIGSFWRPHFWGRQVFNILAKNPATGPPQAAIKQSSTMGFFIPAPVALEAQDSTKVSEKRRQLHCCQHDKSFLHRCSSGVKQRLREQLPCSCLHPLPAEIRFCSIQATNTGSAIELRAMKSWPPCAACNCAFAHDLPKKGQLRSPKNGPDFGAQKQGRKQQPAT